MVVHGFDYRFADVFHAWSAGLLSVFFVERFEYADRQYGRVWGESFYGRPVYCTRRDDSCDDGSVGVYVGHAVGGVS